MYLRIEGYHEDKMAFVVTTSLATLSSERVTSKLFKVFFNRHQAHEALAQKYRQAPGAIRQPKALPTTGPFFRCPSFLPKSGSALQQKSPSLGSSPGPHPRAQREEPGKRGAHPTCEASKRPAGKTLVQRCRFSKPPIYWTPSCLWRPWSMVYSWEQHPFPMAWRFLHLPSALGPDASCLGGTHCMQEPAISSELMGPV